MPQQVLGMASEAPVRCPGVLARRLNRLGFRTKFVIVGLALSMPLCLLAGFAAASFDREVQASQARTMALRQSAVVRELMTAMALHRGLSAAVLAGGGTALQAPLQAQQVRVDAALGALRHAFDDAAWRGVGLADPAGLAAEIQALAQWPPSPDAQRNFERHGRVIDALIGTLQRVGLTISGAPSQRDSAAAYQLAFVALPALMEDLGRQRGWGSAVLRGGDFSAAQTRAYLLYAGSSVRRLQQLRVDGRTLAALEARLPPSLAGGLGRALAQAEAYARLSLDAVLSHVGGASAASAHFQNGTDTIEALRGVVEALGGQLEAEAAAELQRAERGRTVSLVFLTAVVVGLLSLYLAFERSTVVRLRALQQAAKGLAEGQFDKAIEVDGSDEIARLGAAFEEMRQRLRVAIDERAAALAARDADRARSEFLARWSHELRTPLAAVLGFACLLEGREDGALSAAQREDLARIRGAAERLTSLVDTVLGVVSEAPTTGALPSAALQGRVVYVDDDALNQLLFAAMLSHHAGLEVVGLSSAAEALAWSGSAHLWVIDRHLLDGDGVALLEQLRARHGPDLRAVMFSADALPERRTAALAAGFLDYWVKPLAAEALQAALARWLPAR